MIYRKSCAVTLQFWNIRPWIETVPRGQHHPEGCIALLEELQTQSHRGVWSFLPLHSVISGSEEHDDERSFGSTASNASCSSQKQSLLLSLFLSRSLFLSLSLSLSRSLLLFLCLIHHSCALKTWLIFLLWRLKEYCLCVCVCVWESLFVCASVFPFLIKE